MQFLVVRKAATDHSAFAAPGPPPPPHAGTSGSLQSICTYSVPGGAGKKQQCSRTNARTALVVDTSGQTAFILATEVYARPVACSRH